MTAAPRLGEGHRGDGEPSFGRALDRVVLAHGLRERVFPHAAPAGAAPRLGAEVEIIPIDAANSRPLPLDGPGLTTLSVLRRASDGAGWLERRSAKANVPEVDLRDGGRITFEPGGQIEISSAPNASLTALVAGLRDTVSRIAEAAPSNVRLLAKGLDPCNPVETITPQLDAERYRRMLRHFDRIGPSGARMMRTDGVVPGVRRRRRDAGPDLARAQRARAVHGRDLRELGAVRRAATPGTEAIADTSGRRSTRDEPVSSVSTPTPSRNISASPSAHRRS
jgi:hypothetical protein